MVASEIYSLLHGTITVVLTTIGELVVCNTPEVIVRLDFTYKFLRGVCDDRGGIPCDGRVTSLSPYETFNENGHSMLHRLDLVDGL